MKFKVLRQHDGDRQYMAGDTREAKEADVAHLVRLGVLEPVREAAPRKAPPENKSAVAPEAKGR